MKLLLLHLSDIHISGPNDVILSRANSIANAAATLLPEVDLPVIVGTGDIAYSGTKDQYARASEFFTTISSRLGKIYRPADTDTDYSIAQVIVPGNHDCDFSFDNLNRQLVVDKFPKLPAIDTSIVDGCTSVQTAYFAFQSAVSSARANASGAHDPRLYWEHRFSFGKDTIRFLCCNTAWLSRKKELQGSLFFPPNAIPPRSAEETLTIAAFHHPFNWYEASNGNAFRRALEDASDILLTGHEHEADAASYQRSQGSNNTYLAGGVLQDSDSPQHSTFHALLIDTEKRQQRRHVFAWDGSKYASKNTAEWEPFSTNRVRTQARLEFNDRMRDLLEDPGVTTVHEAGTRVRLQDFFVYPDLREFSLSKDNHARVIRAENLIDFVSQTPELVITGDGQAGKTSLAKMLMLEFLKRGEVPILIQSSDVPPSVDQLSSLLEDTFVSQYTCNDRDIYRQLSRERKVVIVDDYHKLRLTTKHRRRLFLDLSTRVGRTVFLANDFLFGVEDLVRADLEAPVVHYRIQPFGHGRRHRLVEKWLLLDDQADPDTSAFAHRVMSMNRTLDTLIGSNFVPAYPPYILAVLQDSRETAPVDIYASTHSYFYELFIRTSLARGRTSVQYDIMLGYLAHIAYRFYESGENKLGIDRLRAIHREYESISDIASLDFDRTSAQLFEQRILFVENDEGGFKYKFVYYYFVACYIRDHITEPEVREHISLLARSLHHEEHANIMLFLAHVSRDPIIIEEMLEAAKRMYASVAPVFAMPRERFAACRCRTGYFDRSRWNISDFFRSHGPSSKRHASC